MWLIRQLRKDGARGHNGCDTYYKNAMSRHRVIEVQKTKRYLDRLC